MNMNKYQAVAKKAIDLEETALTYLALGLVGEAGEVIELIKKYIYRGNKISREAITHELGDVLFYLSQLAAWLDIPLEEVAKANIEKQKKRYPERFTEEEGTTMTKTRVANDYTAD